jgi:hypothetical protein
MTPFLSTQLFRRGLVHYLRMPKSGIDTLISDGSVHVLVWAMKPISYARHRFPPDVIRHAVWLYLRFTLSYRDVEDLLAERGLTVRALSHCQIVHAANLLARQAHAAATTSCHVCMADALKARCVLAEVRWRWTLKVFWAAACTERNLCADPTLLNPCIFLSLRRVG